MSQNKFIYNKIVQYTNIALKAARRAENLMHNPESSNNSSLILHLDSDESDKGIKKLFINGKILL